MARIKLVKITDKESVHYGEHGWLNGEQKVMFGEPEALIKLINCAHNQVSTHVRINKIQVLRGSKAK
jgi:hypothetical protein